MRLLFYKPDFRWPRASGHDVHTYHMMRAMSRLGARVGVVSLSPPDPRTMAGIDLDLTAALSENASETAALQLRWREERYRSYWGVRPDHIVRFGRLAEQFRADAVVVSGLDVLPMLGAVRRAQRVWYAADEWCWHHLTQVSWRDPGSWTNIREAIVKGMYERAYNRRLDRVWVVTGQDARAMRWVAGVDAVDVLPNGVDAQAFKPTDGRLEQADSAVFWGRLDFGPNVQALQWFCRQVWPRVRRRRPDARFTIVGFDPGTDVRALASGPGISLRPNVDDLTTEVARHGVVVLPFVSGAGIKNKLLEAAAMGKATVSTRRGLLGLVGHPPIMEANDAESFSEAVVTLWADQPRRQSAGAQLRAWVEQHHDWTTVASAALERLTAPGRLKPPVPSLTSALNR